MGDPTADLLPPTGAAPAARTRCPHCSAAVRPQAPWCTQCFRGLTPAPPPVAEPPVPETPETPGPVAEPRAPRLPAGAPADATWPCAGCGHANPLADQTCSACGAGFLAGLRDSEAPLLALPVVGDLTRLSRAQRLGLALLVLSTVLGLLAGLTLLLG